MTEKFLMRFDISAQRVKDHGPGFRPYDGQETFVSAQFVQDMRDKGWQIVKPKEYN